MGLTATRFRSGRRPSISPGALRTIFKEGVTSFDVAQNIVVLKTMPGLASAACAAIDGMEIANLVGSLAGDDTAVLIMRTNEDAAEFCKRDTPDAEVIPGGFVPRTQRRPAEARRNCARR